MESHDQLVVSITPTTLEECVLATISNLGWRSNILKTTLWGFEGSWFPQSTVYCVGKLHGESLLGFSKNPSKGHISIDDPKTLLLSQFQEWQGHHFAQWIWPTDQDLPSASKVQLVTWCRHLVKHHFTERYCRVSWRFGRKGRLSNSKTYMEMYLSIYLSLYIYIYLSWFTHISNLFI